MSLDSNLTEVLLAIISAFAAYFGGYRYGRKRFRRSDIGRGCGCHDRALAAGVYCAKAPKAPVGGAQLST